jgi:biofilm PGA synthesis N-glycosyltransferase PgaC
MILLIVLFWVFFALALHPYITYPFVIMILSSLRPRPAQEAHQKPLVTVVIPAYNEENGIERRVRNLLEMDWPVDRLEVIVVSDGSEDRTNEIVRALATSDPRVRLLDIPRGGKCAAINAGAAAASGEIVLLTDVPTQFAPDVISKLVAHLGDPRVWVAVGTVNMLPFERTPLNFTEGLYWRFESRLREMEARAGLAFIGSGACIAVRRDRFPQLEDDASDDLNLVLKVIAQGGRAVQVANIGVYDYMDGDVSKQLQSRTRRVVRSLTTISRNVAIMNPLNHPDYAFCVISHKVLRWMSPLWLIGMLVTSAGLFAVPFYRYAFFAQTAFYGLALVGLVTQRLSVSSSPLLAVPLGVVVANVAFLRGLVTFLTGGRLRTHEPTRPQSER